MSENNNFRVNLGAMLSWPTFEIFWSFQIDGLSGQWYMHTARVYSKNCIQYIVGTTHSVTLFCWANLSTEHWALSTAQWLQCRIGVCGVWDCALLLPAEGLRENSSEISCVQYAGATETINTIMHSNCVTWKNIECINIY